MKKHLLIALSALLIAQTCYAGLTSKQKHMLSLASKTTKNGWIQINIQGKPYERGFQYGYLVSKEFADAYRTFKYMTYQQTGVTLKTFTKVAVKLDKPKIPKEYLQEMQGIADGLTAAGVPMTLNQVIGWNAYTGISEYWWPAIGSQHFTKYVKPGLLNESNLKLHTMSKNHHFSFKTLTNHFKHRYGCSAFLATGKATADGKIVIGHETFDDFYSGQYDNIILTIKPEHGHKLMFQTQPGLIQSGTDFWVTGAGLVIVETTLANQGSYDTKGTPEFIRVRLASQYANSIAQWVEMMQKGNNGSYSNTWLIGNIHTNKIAQFVQGLYYQRLRVKSSGYFFGDNMPSDPRIQSVSSLGQWL